MLMGQQDAGKVQTGGAGQDQVVEEKTWHVYGKPLNYNLYLITKYGLAFSKKLSTKDIDMLHGEFSYYFLICGETSDDTKIDGTCIFKNVIGEALLLIFVKFKSS